MKAGDDMWDEKKARERKDA